MLATNNWLNQNNQDILLEDNDNWLYHGTENAWLHYTYSETVLEYPINSVDNGPVEEDDWLDEEVLEEPITPDEFVLEEPDEEYDWLTDTYSEDDNWLEDDDKCSELVLEDPITLGEVENDQSSTENIGEVEMALLDALLSAMRIPDREVTGFNNIGRMWAPDLNKEFEKISRKFRVGFSEQMPETPEDS